MDFVQCWSEKTEIGAGRLIGWLGITASKFYSWRTRYGQVNEHNGWIPRDFWLEGWEKQAIVNFHLKNPLEGYRRLTFMMLDAGIVAVSPSSVWRVLSQAGLLRKWNGAPSKKGTILLITNYTGDRLHFGLAAERAKASGLGSNVCVIPATDDVSIGRSKCSMVGRRGLPGHIVSK